MIEIEHLKGLPDGGFHELPRERQAQLHAWYRVRTNPKNKGKSPSPTVGRGRQMPGKKAPGRGR